MSPVLHGKTSPTFPSNQGDFILQSCDKVNFYVWKLVLQLTSAVFGDMFELATKVSPPDYSTSEESSIRARRRSRHSMHGLSPPFVEVSEDAVTLEALLSFIHPNVPRSTFHSLDILIATLRAAQKYAMDQVVLTLGVELVRSRVVDGKVVPSFAETDPLRVFAIARDLGLQAESQIAAVATLNVNLHSAAASVEVDRMPTMFYREILRLRKERKDWVKAHKWWTISMHQPGQTSHCPCGTRHRDIPDSVKQTILKAPTSATIRNLDLTASFPCLRCQGAARRHFANMAAVYDEYFSV